MVERAKPILWERKRCRLSQSIQYQRQEQTEGSYLEKRIKRHSQTCFSGREEKYNLCWKDLGKRCKKRYFREGWKWGKKKECSYKWLKRNFGEERSVTLIKQGKPWRLENQGIINLWCQRDLIPIWKEHFRDLQALQSLLCHLKEADNSYHISCIPAVRIIWEMAQKSLDTREFFQVLKSWTPLTNFNFSQVDHSVPPTWFFKKAQ